MIADDTTGAPRTPGSWRISRRGFLALAGAAGMAGAAACVASCAPSANAPAPPTVTASPKPLAPGALVTPGNAARVTRLATFSPQDVNIRGVAWSPDGRVVAAGGAQNIHLWDVTTGKKVGTWIGHQSQIYGMAWSRASGMLASASGDGTVRLWNTRQGTTAKILGRPNDDEAYSVAWSPDGSRVASGLRGGQVMLWDAATGKNLATWTVPALQGARGSHPYAVWGLAWSPDGRRLVSNRYDTKVLVWDAESGKNLALLTPDSQPNGVTWAPDGARFATSGDDGSVQLWDAASYKNTAVLIGGVSDGDGWAFGVTWTPDGSVLAASRAAGSVQLWDTSAGTRLATFVAHEAPIWTAAWSPDGLRLATGSDDTTVALWGVR